MGRYFSDKLEEGIRLVWMQFDYEKAAEGKKLIQQAADEGEADAYSFLGRTWLGASGLEENREQAFALLRKSAQMGSACGIVTMLQFSQLAKELCKSTDQAALLRAAGEVQARAEAGHAFCQLMMGMYYFWGGYWLANGLDIDKEYGNEDKALEARLAGAAPWFEKAVFGGVTVALVNLCDIYEAAPGNEAKLEKAMRFAAECGDRYWWVRLANWLYEQERFTEALGEFERMAEAGYARAWYDAGFQYERGLGVVSDMDKAVADYQQGAKLGSSSSQVRLGKLLLWGKVVPKDEAQAYHWFCQAAQQNDEIAKMWKGHCMFYGMGVKKDVDEATTLLMDALNYNYPDEGESQSMQEESQFNWEEDMLQLFWDLGIAYESGLGMPKRDSLAGYYFNMVADGGWPEAVEKMTHYKYGGLFKRWKRIN